MDNSNQQISVFIQETMQNTFNLTCNQARNILFKNSTNFGTLPIAVDKPIYGKAHPKFTDFIAPGMIVAISFVQALGISFIYFDFVINNI